MFMGHLVSRPNDIRVYGRAVRLTEAGTSWLEEELEAAFGKLGRVRAEEVADLDWLR